MFAAIQFGPVVTILALTVLIAPFFHMIAALAGSWKAGASGRGVGAFFAGMFLGVVISVAASAALAALGAEYTVLIAPLIGVVATFGIARAIASRGKPAPPVAKTQTPSVR